MNILIVEPDPDLGGLLAYLARYAGHTVNIAPDAASALGLLMTAGPDLLLAETVLPDGSGLALCQAVRRIGDAEVILFGDTVDPASSAQALAFGALAYLGKPLSPALLRTKLAAVAVARRAARAKHLGVPARAAVATPSQPAVPA
jgi:DNA-binding response OmpR family regulator